MITAFLFSLICFKFEVSITISSRDMEVYGIGHLVVKRSLSTKVRLQATNSSARSLVSIEKSQGFQTVRCLIGC